MALRVWRSLRDILVHKKVFLVLRSLTDILVHKMIVSLVVVRLGKFLFLPDIRGNSTDDEQR